MLRFRNFIILAISLALCSCTELLWDRMDTTFFNHPWLIVRQDAGFPLLDDRAGLHLAVAVWPNGIILRVHSVSRMGRSSRYELGKVSSEALESLRTTVRATSLSEQKESGAKPTDSPARTITLELAAGQIKTWGVPGPLGEAIAPLINTLLSVPIQSPSPVVWRHENVPSW